VQFSTIATQLLKFSKEITETLFFNDITKQISKILNHLSKKNKTNRQSIQILMYQTLAHTANVASDIKTRVSLMSDDILASLANNTDSSQTTSPRATLLL
jgi:hypothetical protein